MVMVQPSPAINPAINIVDSEYEQVVVDVDDLRDKVKPLLDEFGINHVEIDQIDAFGVVLVGIAPLSVAAVDGLPGAAQARADIRAYSGAQTETPLDVLLRIIRNRYPGAAEPQMGKNRDVDQLEALPHVGGGEGLPAPVAAKAFPLQDPVAAPNGPKIGVLDSAMYPNKRLEGRYKSDALVTDRPPRRAWEAHAAFVVGRILLRAPDADITVRKVLDTNGMAKAWDVAYQMADLAAGGVTVINMSLGCFTEDNTAPFLLTRAAQRVTKTALIVAAAGNHGVAGAAAIVEGRDGPTPTVLTRDPKAPVWPAALRLPRVIAVGAAAECSSGEGVRLRPADFTPRADWINVWAPGVDVASTFLDGYAAVRVVEMPTDDNDFTVEVMNLGPFDGYATWSGTSAATGDVTGEIVRLAKGAGLLDAEDAVQEIHDRPRVGLVDGTDIRPYTGDTDWETPLGD
jgi:membrane-anchored mycosin MYCP